MLARTLPLLLLFCAQFTLAQDQFGHQWSGAIKGSDQQRIKGMARDDTGNVYVTGWFKDSADFGPGPGTESRKSLGATDIFLAKYGPNGELRWVKQFGGSDHDGGRDIKLDPKGNIFLTGYFKDNCDFDPSPDQAELLSEGSEDVFLAKYDPAGNYQWSFSIGDNDEEKGTKLAVDENGDVYLTGYFQETADFDPDPVDSYVLDATSWDSDIFIAKYKGNTANFVWARSFGDRSKSYDDWPKDLALDNNGYLYLTGVFKDTIDLDAGPDSNYVTVPDSSGDSPNIFFTRYDTSGTFDHGFALGRKQQNDRGMEIAVEDDGTFYLGGIFNNIVDFDPGPDSAQLSSVGGDDIFLAKYGPTGKHRWSFNVGTKSDDAGPRGLELDGDGHVIVAGGYGNWGNTADFDPDPFKTDNIKSQGDGDIFVAKYDTTMEHVAAQGFGASNWEAANALSLDTTGNVWIGGHFRNKIDFAPGPDTAYLNSVNGGMDGFIAQYCAPPTVSVDSFPNVCADAAPFPLTGGEPSGGTYSGPGVSNGTFYPGSAGSGTHVVQYTYSNSSGCSNTASRTITVHPVPEKPSIKRKGPDTLQTDLVAENYQWFRNGQAFGPNARKVEVTQAGSYAVRLSEKGCSSDTSEVFCFIPLSVDNKEAASCGNADGSATISVDGGTQGRYTYQWSSGHTVPQADSLEAGLYTVTVKDTVRGCENTLTIAISDDGGPQVTPTVTHVTCNGAQDGAIDLAITGSAPPFDIKWSTGSPNASIDFLSGGVYDVTVTDTNGCKTIRSIQVNEPAPLQISTSTTPSGCGNENGNASVEIAGGTPPYFIEWSTGETTTKIVDLAAGVYPVTVTDDNGCQITTSANVSETGAPEIAVDAVLNAECDGSNGSVLVTVTGGLAPYSYSWSNGDTTEDLIDVPAGTYDLTVTGANECIATESVELPVQPPPEQEICLVTVDSSTQTNKVVWEKSNDPIIERYVIYRESSQSGQYFQIGTVDSDSLSVFVDSSADPSVRSWRYKLSTIDTCGNESALSSTHKSIHLTINQGIDNTINLIWDDYIGFNFGTYKLSRYTDVAGWETISYLPDNVSSYTDTANMDPDVLSYMVEVVPPTTCVATRAEDYNSSRSNRGTVFGGSSTGIKGQGSGSRNIVLFPDPSGGEFELRFKGRESIDRIEVYDMLGRKVRDVGVVELKRRKGHAFDFSNEDAGLYHIRVLAGERIFNEDVVIQK